MNIETLVVGSMAANCFIVDDIIIDPGDDAEYIISHLKEKPSMIVATHGHFDHIMAARELQLIFQIPFFIHENDRFLVDRMKETAKYFLKHEIVETPPRIDKFLSEGDRVGNFTVMHTPGHTPGSICLLNRKEHALFTGDTIFAGGAVGRTDFSYSDKKKLNTSLERIFQLPDAIRILPGHGEPASIAAEKLYYLI